MNHSQRNLKKLIRAKEDSIADEELFLSAAYQKYQTCNSIYRLSYTRVPMELEAMCA